MNKNAWGEREKTIQEIFLKGNSVQKFRNVTDIELYTAHLGLDIFEEFIIEEFYSPLQDRYYQNMQIDEKINSLYQQPRVHHTATLLLARNSKIIKDIHQKDLHVAGLVRGTQDYLVANEKEQNGRIQPQGYRLSDIILYQPSRSSK